MDLINKQSWASLITIASIVCGIFYLEDRLTKIIYNAVNPINARVEILEIHVKELKESKVLTDYKMDVFEKYFVKPNDVKLKDEK